MARIRHIALVTDDPAKTAEFYKEHFGLTEAISFAMQRYDLTPVEEKEEV
jgi:catechol 2,3-dioxygenase-like lactoylglutathione lyase family enzyme